MFATAKIGAVLVTINTRLPQPRARIRRQAVGSDGAGDHRQLPRPQLHRHGLRPRFPSCAPASAGTCAAKSSPSCARSSTSARRSTAACSTAASCSSSAARATMRACSRSAPPSSCHDVINMQYTSGTTGFPKGVMLSHYNILNNGYYIGDRQKFTDKDRLCLPVPLFHCFGCVLGRAGGADARRRRWCRWRSSIRCMVLAAVQKEKCTALYGVPTMFIAELATRCSTCSTSPPCAPASWPAPPARIETMRQVIDKMHCTDITIAYGLTEASPVITQTRTDDTVAQRKSAPSAPPCRTSRSKIVDPETGELCAPGAARRAVLPRLQHHEGLLQDARGRPRRRSTPTAGCTPATRRWSMRRATTASPAASRT